MLDIVFPNVVDQFEGLEGKSEFLIEIHGKNAVSTFCFRHPHDDQVVTAFESVVGRQLPYE